VADNRNYGTNLVKVSRLKFENMSNHYSGKCDLYMKFPSYLVEKRPTIESGPLHLSGFDINNEPILR
jgi:hypothetical protein